VDGQPEGGVGPGQGLVADQPVAALHLQGPVEGRMAVGLPVAVTGLQGGVGQGIRLLQQVTFLGGAPLRLFPPGQAQEPAIGGKNGGVAMLARIQVGSEMGEVLQEQVEARHVGLAAPLPAAGDGDTRLLGGEKGVGLAPEKLLLGFQAQGAGKPGATPGVVGQGLPAAVQQGEMVIPVPEAHLAAPGRVGKAI